MGTRGWKSYKGFCELERNQSDHVTSPWRSPSVGGGQNGQPRRIFLHEVSPLKVQRDVHQSDQRRNFDQRPDHCREGGPGIDAEHRYRHRDRQLEIIAGSRKRQRRRLGVVAPSLRPM